MEPTGAPPGGVHTEGGGPSREPRWAEPEDVSAAPDDCVLSAEQVEQWRTQRYLVLDGLFPAQLIAEAVACHTDEFPTPTPERPGAELAVDAGGGFGGIGTSREFPFDEAHDVYNMLTLHPRALKACEQLLDTSDLRVTRSNYGAKYGGGGFEKPRTAPDQNGWDASVTGDQTMHWDYGNNTMLVPSAERPDCVAGICYLNHVEDGGGATGIVPYDPNLPTHSDMPGEGVEGWGRSDGWVGQSVYEAERLVRYRPGTILLYRMDTCACSNGRHKLPRSLTETVAANRSSGHPRLSGGSASGLGSGVAAGGLRLGARWRPRNARCRERRLCAFRAHLPADHAGPENGRGLPVGGERLLDSDDHRRGRQALPRVRLDGVQGSVVETTRLVLLLSRAQHAA